MYICEREREKQPFLEAFLEFTRPYEYFEIFYVCFLVETKPNIIKTSRWLFRVSVWLRERNFPNRVG